MEYVIAVYRSRNITIRAYNFLLKNGVTAALVSTPRSVNVGCGLSVKFAVGTLPRLANALSGGETFVGFYLVKSTVSGTLVTRI